ncbi:acyl-CoA dehydrogenase family protein [Solwaraspora sp. WMMD406]|uniref:acyl-CoA dehydrogenase family protein n=1 Tax=Solwaraspora sp. WMMD406 TaxID=3016095 RepID=UPI002416EA8A|nr:acyl-CoA dehydrogenase family protein [Solwaraspora sp. WMMD406]MDG4764946.1 acyl-CoA dehydrogenase family protein [Solwaraspora sp. WMMD406]
MLDTQAPHRPDLVGRAAELVPLLRKHALWHEENRRLHDEVLEAMTASGVLRMRIPHRYGGYESDARTVLDVITELGRGDGSAAWTASVWSISNWLACLFPDEVQDEVFSSPDIRVCGVLTPSAAVEPTAGGFTLNGQWRFVSGALHSQWQAIIAMGPAPDGTQWPVMAMVPMADLEIVDDWHTVGLRGTGSVTVVARQVFIPQQRLIPMVAVLSEQYASRINAAHGLYRQPMMATGCTTFTGAAIGLARAGLEEFLTRLPERKISYTSYDSQREAPLTHFQVAESALEVDEAEFHARRLASTVDDKSDTGAPWSVQERASARVSLGRVFQLTAAAVGRLRTASGGTSIYRDVPIQRIDRDLQTLNMHALMHPNTNLELYGRVLCGLEPNTAYI